MRTEEELQVLAVELYVEVHSRLEHGAPEDLRQHFSDNAFSDIDPRARMWLEIARLYDERLEPVGRWLEYYAETIFIAANQRRGHQEVVFYDVPWVRRRVWYEVARVFAESFNMEDPRLEVLRRKVVMASWCSCRAPWRRPR